MTDILITGGAGQVGIELARATWFDGVTLHCPTRSELDLQSPADVAAYFAGKRMDLVVNSAAYTAVDKAEDDVAAAFSANATGVAALADETRRRHIPLIQISTDYVFDGAKSGFYAEDAPVAPLGVYGASKLAGEYAALSGNPRAVILRTAWVLSAHRNNFVKTMRRLAAIRDEIGVVADQFGCPTAAADIARAVVAIASAQLSDPDIGGVYHFVNAGEASWHALAEAVFALGAGPTPVVKPITTADFPTPARRPANSRLSTAKLTRDFGIVPRPWRDAVSDIVAELELNEKKASGQS